MKFKTFYGGIVLAIALFMCGASFASPFTDTGIYASEPVYETSMSLAVDPPLVPAAKPDNSGFDQAMATSPDVDKDRTVPCMASCRSAADNVLAMACGGKGKGKGKPKLYLICVDQAIPKNVLACGTRSKPIDTPMKIPIRA